MLSINKCNCFGKKYTIQVYHCQFKCMFYYYDLLQLGFSFTVPFLSIPMASLLNIGDVTTNALATILNVNWPSTLVIGTAVLAAALFLPLITEWVSTLFLVKNTGSFSYGYGGAPTGYGAYREEDELYSRSSKDQAFKGQAFKGQAFKGQAFKGQVFKYLTFKFQTFKCQAFK